MITIKVLNPVWNQRNGVAFHMEQYNTYTGEIVPNPRWVGDDKICLSTGNPKFPFRVIDKDRVIGMDAPAKVDSPKVVTIPGSKPGQSYLVTLSKHPSCTCVGFGYRKDCKHVRMALAA